MYNPKLFEARDQLLKNLLLLNQFDRERYEALIIQDYKEIKRLTLEMESLEKENKDLTEVQKKLEAEARVKRKFHDLKEFVFLNKDGQHSELFVHLVAEILDLIQQTKKKLAVKKARDEYFDLVAIEQYFKN